MAIYTRLGDRGKTKLFNLKAKNIPKDSPIIEALGSIDELNSFLGIVRSKADKNLNLVLKKIQENLFIINSIISGSNLNFSSVETRKLERLIDRLEGSLPVLKKFIFPGGSEMAALLQYSRTLARKTERKVVALSKDESINPHILSYLNRLSDAFFMLSREENRKSKVKEEIWKAERRL